MKRRSFTLAGVTVLAHEMLAPAIAHAADTELLVYNAQHESLTKAWAAAFTKDTGIPVTLRNGNDMELANQIVQEGAASPADVFLTENSPAMALVDHAGLFAPLSARTIGQVAPAYRPSHERWIGIAARSTVFVYNKNKLKAADLPRSIMDLADPRWKGRWGAAPAGADFQAIVSAMLELKGEAATLAWLRALKTGATAYRGNTAVLKAVNEGQIDGGVLYHYYRYIDQSKTGENSGNTETHYFRHQDPGAFLSLSGGGVLASSKRAAQAQTFLGWITSKAGQELLSNLSFEYPVGSGVPANPKLVPLTDLQIPKVDAALLNSRKTVDLMTQAGLL